jgi:hypothetical protein
MYVIGCAIERVRKYVHLLTFPPHETEEVTLNVLGYVRIAISCFPNKMIK